MKHRRTAWQFTLALFAVAPLARGDDACSDILRFGMHDVFASVEGGTLATTMHSWACTTPAAQVAAVMTQATAPVIPGVAVGRAFRASMLTHWRARACASPGTQFSAEEAEAIAGAVLSQFVPDAAGAFADCANSRHAHGPQAPISARITTFPDANGSFQLRLTWAEPHASGAAAPTLASPQVTGATCAHLNNAVHLEATGGARDFVCERAGRDRVTFTLNTSEGPVRPLPALPAAATSAMCGEPLARANLDDDPMNCGMRDRSCGAQGTCAGGYCTECVYGLGELTLAGTDTFPVSQSAEMPVSCPMAAGRVNASFEANVWIQAGHHTPGNNSCTTPLTAGVAVQLNGVFQPGFKTQRRT